MNTPTEHVVNRIDLPVEWIRVREAIEYSRLSKGLLYNLMSEGHIRYFSNRRKGQTKGTRLIDFQSLRKYLNDRATGGGQQDDI